MQQLAAFFYVDDGFFTSTQPETLHWAFGVLSGLFDRVGLRKNTRKTVIMACHLFHKPGRMLVEAYERPKVGTGTMFQERQRMQVQCTECRVEIAAGLLLIHRQSQRGVYGGDQGGAPPPQLPGRPRTTGLLPENAVATLVPGRGVLG